MENENMMFLDKANWNTNDVYCYIREVDDRVLFRKVDTITKDVEIVSIKKEDMEDRFYSVEEFFENACYIGESGYYDEMLDIEKQIYQTYVLLYKDPYHELLYDTILDNYMIAGSVFKIESFMVYEREELFPVKIRKDLFEK